MLLLHLDCLVKALLLQTSGGKNQLLYKNDSTFMFRTISNDSRWASRQQFRDQTIVWCCSDDQENACFFFDCYLYLYSLGYKKIVV